MRFRLILSISLLIACTVGVWAFFWWLDVPLGIAGEWKWGRHVVEASSAIWSVLVASGLLIVGLGFAWWGDLCPAKRLETCSLKQTRNVGWLVGLVVFGFCWLWMITALTNPNLGLGRGPLLLNSHGATGYFSQARDNINESAEFLATYEDLVSGRKTGQRDEYHIGTHPPGLTMLYLGLLKITNNRPTLNEFVRSTEPRSVDDAQRMITRTELAHRRRHTTSHAAVLWLASLLTIFVTSLTVVPLYHWLRVTEDRIVAWRVCCFWPLVPAVAIFFPKSDLLFPCIGMAAACCWRVAWNRRSLWLALLSGAILFFGMTLSLAFLPVGVLMAVQSLLDGWPGKRTPQLSDDDPSTTETTRWRSIAMLLMVGALGFLLPVLLCWWQFDLNLLSVWRWNFLNHKLFYERHPRSYAGWMLRNPLELAFAVGLPITLAALWGTFHSLRQELSRWIQGVPAIAFVWTLLWLSGKTSGEAARLWIFLTPWILVAVAPLFRPRSEIVSNEMASNGPICPARADRPTQWFWLLFLFFQGITAILTTLRVDGFHFSESYM